MTIEVKNLMGLSSDRIYTCDLGNPGGRAILTRPTLNAVPGGAPATPLGAFIDDVKDCGSAAEVRAGCSALAASS